MKSLKGITGIFRGRLGLGLVGIILALAWTTVARADEAGLFIVSAGVSSTNEKFNPLNEHLNKSNQYSLRYEGRRFGLRLDHSVHGDDDGNTYITGDVLARPWGSIVMGAGLSYAKQPLRGIGRQENLHAMIGIEDPSLFGPRTGAGAWFDHWSNGHIHRIIGWDDVPNPPRNVISGGIIHRF